jgi:Holliday junction DNA helicase RuvA
MNRLNQHCSVRKMNTQLTRWRGEERSAGPHIGETAFRALAAPQRRRANLEGKLTPVATHPKLDCRGQEFHSVSIWISALIGHLSGKLIFKQPSQVVIEVGGVGYEVTIPLSTFYDLGDVGSQLALTIHTHVREDALELFGFRTKTEKDLFLKLTSVSGIGPKLGITILSGMPVGELIQVISAGDVARLALIPRVGRKIAERVAMELRDKMKGISPAAEAVAAFGATSSSDAGIVDDAVSALISLGYPKAVAERTVAAAVSEAGDRTIEGVLKRSLRKLSK